MNWAPFPLLRVAITLSAGIFLQEYAKIESVCCVIGFFLFLLLWLLAEKLWKNLIVKSAVTGFLMLCTTFFLGTVLLNVKYVELEKKNIALDNPVYIAGTLLEKLKSSTTQKYIFKSAEIRTENGMVTHPANVIVSFKNTDEVAATYKPGNRIYLKAKFNKTVPNTNPEAFDYAKYLKYKSIEYIGFVNPGDHHFIDNAGFNFFRRMASKSTLYTQEAIHKYIQNKEAVSIAEALLVGVQLNISDEIYKSYADTGAIHVLSVSGMHVAIFIAFFIFLLNSVHYNSLTWKCIKVFILLIIVWFYVILTGMAPSVMRAGMMVSMYVVGSTFFKGHSTYNILAFTAIAMLFYDPFYLFQISFQLSFISLLSILFFQPKIEQWWKPQNKFLKTCWSLINVSLAAQILIFPISVYIFHQFSLSFALSSLLAVPLVSIVIYGGSVMVLMGLLWTDLASLIGLFVEYCIVALNFVILKISQIPFSVLTKIYISEFELVLLLIFVCGLMYWAVLKVKRAFWLSLGSLLAVLFSGAIDKIQKNHQSFIVIYDMYGNDVIDVGNGKKVIRMVNGDKADNRIQNVTNNFLVKSRIKQVIYYDEPLFKLNSGWLFNYRSVDDISRLKQPLTAKYLFVSANERYQPEHVLEFLQADTIILSPNLKPWIAKKWVALRDYCDYFIHDIKTEGAFLKFNH